MASAEGEIADLVRLRDEIYSRAFRFLLSPDLWERHYVVEGHDIEVLREDGNLKGFFVATETEFLGLRAYTALELCAKDRRALSVLLNKMLSRARDKNVAVLLIYMPKEEFKDIFRSRGFLSIPGVLGEFVLLNPGELLTRLSKDDVGGRGRYMKLSIAGFKPLFLEIGRQGFRLCEKPIKHDFEVRTDRKTFLRLFFGMGSFVIELLRGRIRVSKWRFIPLASRFFSMIRQEEVYIPPGDKL